MKKVMIWGWFGFENLGDDLLLNTMLQNINNKNIDITIPMAKEYRFKDNVIQVKRSYKNLILGYLQNDILIIGPGGLFPFDNKLKVGIYLITVLLWKLFNKKVIFWGIGISEKISKLSAILWKNIIKNTDLFITRNKSFLMKLGHTENKKIHSMSDTVFSLKLNLKKKDESPIIGISCANLKKEKDKAFKENVKIWIDTIEELLHKGFSVELLAFTKGQDDVMIKTIKNNFYDNNKVVLVCYNEINDIIGDWGKYTMIIGMRFHSCILSIIAGVPFLPIAYGHKTYSLAKDTGLEEYTLIWNSFQKEYYGKIYNITADDIIKKVDMIMTNKESIKEKIKLAYSKNRKSSNNAFKELEYIIAED